MSELSTFEVFLLSALFLSAFAKFIPLWKEWGDIKFQKIQIILSFLLLILFIALRQGLFSVEDKEVFKVFSGMTVFIFFAVIFITEIWFLAIKIKIKQKNASWSSLISPAINAVVLFGGIFLLLVISVQANLL